MTGLSDIPDLLDVDVPVGGRVLVVSDLHLTRDPSAAQTAATAELAARLREVTGPAVLLINGNLLAGPTTDPRSAEPKPALTAHSRLCDDIAAFANGPGRKVVVLPGERDVRLAWSAPAQAAVRSALHCDIALAVDLHVATGAGERLVRVEPGHRFDPITAYQDPRNPLESPLGQHLREDIIPSVRRRLAAPNADPDGRTGRWLNGIGDLDDAASLSRFFVSRLVYRRLVHSAWLLAVPLAVAFVFRIPATILRSARAGDLHTRLGIFALATVVELLLLFLVAILAIRVTNRALGAFSPAERSEDSNAAARAAARELVTAGHAGLIAGHTCRPELTRLGHGFYANAGAATEVVTEYPSRLPGLGLPSIFLGHRVLSWLELEAGNDLHAELHHARQDLPGASLTERLLAARNVESAPGELCPEVVAAFPRGQSWPRPPTTDRADRRARRLAAATLVLFGFTSLVSAMSDPLRDRLDILRQLFPLAVPETAAALTALAGVTLIVLARSIRRGQRRAWLACEALLLASALVHLVKGVDVEESLIALALAGLLWVFRGSFQARTDVTRMRRALLSIAGAAVLTLAAGTIAVELSTAIDHRRHHANPKVSWVHALDAAAARMVGSGGVALPHRIDAFLSPTMATASAGLVVALVVVLFRPVVARGAEAAGRRRFAETEKAVQPETVATPDTMSRARAVVGRHGSDTLDYFALRPDKDFFFWGDTVIAHAVYGGVCLVSPDPVGPPAEREEAWRAFRRHVDHHGWALGGLGIGEDWLPIYRASGMHDLYVGDEAIVRLDRFSLEGGRFKGLRQAVNRVAKYGYRISFHDPAELDENLRETLRQVMTKSRRGDVERGFSMTLGRVFDPADTGLLLAVVHGPATGEGEFGPPVAFCQYVPAPGIGGYSLDLMRRDSGDHPNGLIDFAVVETIKELHRRGLQGLGLNFATMRAVLAGEAGEGAPKRVLAWLLRRLGGSMQIESLWRFNAKFDPDWQPRYAIYDARENMLKIALAIARAESFWELPVIGRFLVPAGPGPTGGSGAP